jgi:HD-like signal output (HDOD) protein
MENKSRPDSIDIARKIEQESDLLALPASVARILELSGQDEDNFEEISEVVSSDPALIGRILRIANSPYYGLSHQVKDVHQAIMVLGMTTVKCLILSAAIFQQNNISSIMEIDFRALYGNIISIAITCRKLAVACKYPAPEEAFTCGLLHDVGALFFMNNYPVEYNKVLKRAMKSGNLVSSEKESFGHSHAGIGRMISEKWRLPKSIVKAIGNHDTLGDANSDKLDDIIRLGVALNRDTIYLTDHYIEDKITKIGTISKRLEIKAQQLSDITSSIMKDTVEFAKTLDVNIGDTHSMLTRANKELFNTYMSIQKLFKERQELTNRILTEERERGVLEAKRVAVSTLAHYINNACMSISGQAQVVRMHLKSKTPEELADFLPKSLDTIDEAVNRSVAVLEELSDLNLLEDVEFFSESKVLNIDERIKQRLKKLENSRGILLPEDAEKIRNI